MTAATVVSLRLLTYSRQTNESKFSLIIFSSEGMDTIRKNEIMEEVKPLASDEYRCAGWTPLYDAIGRGIGILDEASGATPDSKCILLVMTDGQENASREFSHDKTTALIKARQQRGWLVTFLGEGLDVARQGVQMGVHAASTAPYVGAAGLRAAGQVLASCSARYAAASGHFMRAQDEAALTPEERSALTGKE